MTTIAGSQDWGSQSQKQNCEWTCPVENCSQWRGLQGSKYELPQGTALSDTPIWYWDRGHDLELGWGWAGYNPARGRDLKHHLGFKKEYSIRMIEFEAWWESMRIQAFWKTIKQCVIHSGYPKMHLVSHISESIWRMRSGGNFNPVISKSLHIANVKEAYRSSNKVNYIWQILKPNDLCTGVDCMEETLSYLALQGWYDINFAQGFNLMSATDKRRCSHSAHQLHFQTIEHELFIRPVSQQVYHLRETHIRRVCRSIILTSLRDQSEDFRMPNFGPLFNTQIEGDWWHKVSWLVLGYDQNLLLHSIFVKLQNGLLYFHQPFHNPTSVKHLGLDCNVEYTNANQGILPEAHKIWVQYMQCEENDLDNTFQGQIPCIPVLYFCWTPPNQILQLQECWPAGKTLLTFSKRCKKTQHWVLRPQAQEYAVVIPTKYKDLHRGTDCVDSFIWIDKQTNKMHIVPIGAIVGPAHLVWENATFCGIESVWLENNHVDWDTYWTV